MNDRFINGPATRLFTDYGFKKIFGEEPNKDLLIDFLNELLEGAEKINDLTYLKNERLGKNEGERRAVYDLYCSNDQGEKFIVEVQRVKQQFFKDRSLYYSTFAIQEQAAKGKDWKGPASRYELKGVYTIAILDFSFDDTDVDKLEHRIKLMDTKTHKVFYQKLTFIYLEIPKFNKELEELENDYDRCRRGYGLFAFKNLHKLADRPPELEEGIFKRLLEVAEISRMDSREQAVYQESLKEYWDLKSAMETYYEDGIEEGRASRDIEIVLLMHSKKKPATDIAELTGLSEKQVTDIIEKFA